MREDEKNIEINGDIYGVGVAQKGSTVNQDIHLPPHIIPKVLTKETGLANDIDFVGRKEELKKVDELLNQNSMLLLLNGIGGIGKSTLASYYLGQKKDNFDYYGFIQVNKDIKLSLASALGTSLDLKSEKIDDLFAEIMNKLHNLEGKKLLIIDDVKEMDNQLDEMNTLMTLQKSGFQILFTSRETQERLPQYFLDIMSIEDARELFLKYYPTDEMDKVDKILEYLDYHTLFIEITAKTLKQRKRTLSLDKMIEKFANGEFSSIKKNKRESFNLFLSDLFSRDKILQDEENILFLKRLSVLPSIEISFEDLYRFLVCDDEEKLEDFLIEFVDNGWLIESKHAYKFHQILKEFIWDNYFPLFEEIEIQVDYFTQIMGNSEDILVAVNNQKNIIYFENLVKVVNILKTENEKIGTFFNNIGVIYTYLSFYTKAKKIHLKALKIWEKIDNEEYSKGFSSSYSNLAKVYMLMGEYQKSEESHLKGLELQEEIDECLDTAKSYNNLAELYRVKGEYKKAEPLYLKALKIVNEITGEEYLLNTSIFYGNLAGLHESKGEYKQAESFYLKALKIKEKILGIEHPTTAVVYTNLAGLYQLIDEYQKSEQLYFKSLKILKEVLGEEHPDLSTNYNNLANLYRRIGKYKKAEQFYLKALKIRKKILGEEHHYTATTYLNLANVYQSTKEYEKAESFYLKALNITEKVLEKTHPNKALIYNNLAELYSLMGEYKKAEPLYLRALDIFEQLVGEEHPSTATAYNNLARLYQSMEDYSKAKPLYLKSLRIKEYILGKKHTDTATVYNDLGIFYYHQKDLDNAHKYMKKAVEIWSNFFPENHPHLINAKEGLNIIETELKFIQKVTNIKSFLGNIFKKILPKPSKLNKNTSIQSVNNINDKK